MTVTINISDEEQSIDPQQDQPPNEVGMEPLAEAREEENAGGRPKQPQPEDTKQNHSSGVSN